ncbi:hypothetical protein, partial [Rhodopirellula bahusiensis]
LSGYATKRKTFHTGCVDHEAKDAIKLRFKPSVDFQFPLNQHTSSCQPLIQRACSRCVTD